MGKDAKPIPSQKVVIKLSKFCILDKIEKIFVVVVVFLFFFSLDVQ